MRSGSPATQERVLDYRLARQFKWFVMRQARGPFSGAGSCRLVLWALVLVGEKRGKPCGRSFPFFPFAMGGGPVLNQWQCLKNANQVVARQTSPNRARLARTHFSNKVSTCVGPGLARLGCNRLSQALNAGCRRFVTPFHPPIFVTA